MVRVPERVPFAVGVKVTLMVQVVGGATLVPQLSFSAKSPVVVMLLISRGAVPVLVRATPKGKLVESTP